MKVGNWKSCKTNIERVQKWDSLKRKTAKKQPYKINKKDTSENAEALYNRPNIIVDTFENRIESKYRPEIDVDNDATPDSNTCESHGLTKKKFKCLENFLVVTKALQSWGRLW